MIRKIVVGSPGTKTPRPANPTHTTPAAASSRRYGDKRRSRCEKVSLLFGGVTIRESYRANRHTTNRPPPTLLGPVTGT